MNVVIDAQLPRRLVRLFQAHGHTAYHTLDLPQGNLTDDAAIMRFADEHDCTVLTKDSDFVDAFYVRGQPHTLWLISTGNISNPALEALISATLEQVVVLLQQYRFVELTRTDVIAHI